MNKKRSPKSWTPLMLIKCNCLEYLVPVLFAQVGAHLFEFVLHNLAGGVEGKLVYKEYVLGYLVARNFALAEVAHVFGLN